MPDDLALDGELLVIRDGEVAPFNDLQQRLNRKTPTAKMSDRLPGRGAALRHPALGDEDLRALPLASGATGFAAWYGNAPRARLDLSPLVPFDTWDDLKQLRDNARANGIEGLMLKRRDSPYLSAVRKGRGSSGKRGALTIDAVLMYAQRGHGKRSSFYSDYTFGAWRDDALVPVGKAYSGFTDDELRLLDKWRARQHRQALRPGARVAPAWCSKSPSTACTARPATNRASRCASRASHRIRWDKPFCRGDTLENLEKMMT